MKNTKEKTETLVNLNKPALDKKKNENEQNKEQTIQSNIL